MLAGCGAGHNSITIKPYTPTDGNQAQSDAVKVRNFLVVAEADGSGSIIGTVVNAADQSDAITSITINNAPVISAPSVLPLAKNVPVIFGGESANATGFVPALGARAGQLVPVTITFANAAPVDFTAVVREPTGEFTPTAPAPSPSETATP